MRKIVIVGLVFVLSMGVLSCGTKDSTNHRPQKSETLESSQEVALKQEDAVIASEIDSSEVEKKERLKPTEFSNLSKVAEQVGFHFKVPQELPGDRIFNSFMVSQEWEKDENGEKVGSPYPTVTVIYCDKAKFSTRLVLKEAETEPQDLVTYVNSKTIGGLEVSFLDYIIRMVDVGYEMTEEDWELYNSGKVGFSSGGELGDYHFFEAYWLEKGVMYHIRFGGPDPSYEEMEEIIEYIMNTEIQ